MQLRTVPSLFRSTLSTLVVLGAVACLPTSGPGTEVQADTGRDTDWVKWFESHQEFIADGFDFPVGPPDATGYYNAQPFGRNLHLGDDWNGNGGGNTDLGDPVYSIANGYITWAHNEGGGWGKVVRIVHLYEEDGSKKLVESLYAHLDTMTVTKDTWIRRGEQLGTIGNSNGLYYAHLHLEIRDSVDMFIGGGYSHATHGYLRPTDFIKAHRAKRQ